MSSNDRRTRNQDIFPLLEHQKRKTALSKKNGRRYTRNRKIHGKECKEDPIVSQNKNSNNSYSNAYHSPFTSLSSQLSSSPHPIRLFPVSPYSSVSSTREIDRFIRSHTHSSKREIPTCSLTRALRLLLESLNDPSILTYNCFVNNSEEKYHRYYFRFTTNEEISMDISKTIPESFEESDLNDDTEETEDKEDDEGDDEECPLEISLFPPSFDKQETEKEHDDYIKGLEEKSKKNVELFNKALEKYMEDKKKYAWED